MLPWLWPMLMLLFELNFSHLVMSISRVKAPVNTVPMVSAVLYLFGLPIRSKTGTESIV